MAKISTAMTHDKLRSTPKGLAHVECIAACYACADACDRCAVSCLSETDPKPMARCIALDIDCAQACRFAAGFMARGSASDAIACALCADLCTLCAEECARHAAPHCQECVVACRRCADLCLRMSDRVPAAESSAGTHVAH